MSTAQTVIGTDGQPRCRWCAAAPEFEAYHDREWGFPVADDVRLFEKLCLEGFQTGLSWLIILRRRAGFRAAFAGFDAAKVAAFGPEDVERLMGDPGIVRNRRKVEATIANAQAVAALEDVTLSELIWSFEPAERPAPRSMAEIPAATTESAALAKELKRRGFRQLGPTTVYAMMQACGLVDDHLAGCSARVRPLGFPAGFPGEAGPGTVPA
jgi:DNA-3-methyladenine glycosylase I